jgi:hypothetical protein
MPWFKRYEGELITDAPLEQRILGFLSPTRAESLVYEEQDVDARPVLSYLERANAGKSPEDQLTLFHVLLAVFVRTMSVRPKINRFAVGGLLYQRKWIDFSFVVKKAWKEDGSQSAVKVRFDPADTLADVVERVKKAVHRGRKRERTSSEREMRFGLGLPRPLLRLVVRLVRLLDTFNLMPRSMIDADELFASMFVANLGSVGLRAPYHHLYEWGPTPIFCSLGRVGKRAVVNEQGQLEARETIPLRWTIDERIGDGLFFARTLDFIEDHLLHPEWLEQKPQVPAACPSSEPHAAAG